MILPEQIGAHLLVKSAQFRYRDCLCQSPGPSKYKQRRKEESGNSLIFCAKAPIPGWAGISLKYGQ